MTMSESAPEITIAPVWVGDCGGCDHTMRQEIPGVKRPDTKEVWITCAECGHITPVWETEGVR